MTAVPLDVSTAAIPYEARRIEDAAVFASFGRRVQETIAGLVPDPLVAQFWPKAVEAGREHGILGRALAQARHIVEGHWGLRTLELPLSAVCDDTPFRWFAAHLLAEAPRLRFLHNACLAEYRRVHKIRGVTHPVPDLVEDDGWTEVPFWIWTVGQPQRRAAFVRRRGSQVVLSDRRDVSWVLELPEESDAQRCVQQLEEAHGAGLRLRPRALITTMFSRLVLSDIFIHGIGGAKYDQVTDALMRRFFAFEPPAYLVATATLKLPVPRTLVAPEDLRRAPRLLRELRYHPELYLEETAETAPLIAEKRHWIAAEVPAARRRERHQRIKAINEKLHALLADQRRQLREEQHVLRALAHKQAILDSREYAFCLFPAESLRRRLLDLSRQEP